MNQDDFKELAASVLYREAIELRMKARQLERTWSMETTAAEAASDVRAAMYCAAEVLDAEAKTIQRRAKTECTSTSTST